MSERMVGLLHRVVSLQRRAAGRDGQWGSSRHAQGLLTDVSCPMTRWNVYATCGRSAALRGAKGTGTTADVRSADCIRTSLPAHSPRVELLEQLCSYPTIAHPVNGGRYRVVPHVGTADAARALPRARVRTQSASSTTSSSIRNETLAGGRGQSLGLFCCSFVRDRPPVSIMASQSAVFPGPLGSFRGHSGHA